MFMPTRIECMAGYEFVNKSSTYSLQTARFGAICKWQVISRKTSLVKETLQGPFIHTKGRLVVTDTTASLFHIPVERPCKHILYKIFMCACVK